MKIGRNKWRKTVCVTKKVTKAAEKSYEQLKEAHINDYQQLFDRVKLDLGGDCPNIPTDQLMKNYRNGDYQIAVEEMVYQFGRYLTIAGSRQGDALPTNLAGIWCIGDPAWGGDFHFTFTGNYEGIADAAVLENGKKIETVIDAENHRLSFEAEKGKVYTIDLSGEAITDPEQPEQKPGGGTEGETEGSGDANKPENKPDNKPDKKPEIHHGKEQIGTPKTGDEVGIALPISMMFAIAAGSCVILIVKKKRNKNM